ncbi:hypothetical protein OIU84_001750 [Salix udensis]|uniref:Uncharacterized protein n=1 Tax=Salix udensis TaxID=889485 RepID=A0AAD6KA03_9ROSI|nr:hypothetical protein OIU84_001750 [Salix udensis]
MSTSTVPIKRATREVESISTSHVISDIYKAVFQTLLSFINCVEILAFPCSAPKTWRSRRKKKDQMINVKFDYQMIT